MQQDERIISVLNQLNQSANDFAKKQTVCAVMSMMNIKESIRYGICSIVLLEFIIIRLLLGFVILLTEHSASHTVYWKVLFIWTKRMILWEYRSRLSRIFAMSIRLIRYVFLVLQTKRR